MRSLLAAKAAIIKRRPALSREHPGFAGRAALGPEPFIRAAARFEPGGPRENVPVPHQAYLAADCCSEAGMFRVIWSVPARSERSGKSARSFAPIPKPFWWRTSSSCGRRIGVPIFSGSNPSPWASSCACAGEPILPPRSSGVSRTATLSASRNRSKKFRLEGGCPRAHERKRTDLWLTRPSRQASAPAPVST
jgi:hypothetical protein